MAPLSVASPSTIVRLGMGGAGLRMGPRGVVMEASLAGERTRAMTVWWWVRRAGRRRRSRLPVAPRRRTREGLEGWSILLERRVCF
jgi:hypothetical protein